MIFEWPWLLLGLAAVAAAAAWALFRPGRELAVVASLSLWQEALESLDRSQRLRSRRVTASWLLLLAGAAAAVLAAGRPVYRSAAPARSVALALYPSAGLAAPEGMERLGRAAGSLLDRLDPADSVELLLPEGPARRLTAPEARRAVRSVRPLAVPAKELVLPAASGSAQHVYRIAPAGAGLERSPTQTVIELPTSMPPVTIDAFGAEPLADGKVQVFVAVRNHSRAPWRGRVVVSVLAAAGGLEQLDSQELAVQAGGRGQLLFTCGASPAIAAEALDGAGRAISAAYLVRVEGAAVKVAMVGRDEPLVRRYVGIDPELELVADWREANVVVAVGQEGPRGVPALLIAPPGAPPGCPPDGEFEDFVLVGADTVVDTLDPVLKDVELSGVAVRFARAWRLGPPGVKSLCRYQGGSLIVRTAPEQTALAGGSPRRVYVAFALNTENTNFGMNESFVVFLANTMRWLSGQGGRRTRYECLTPAQAGPRGDWRPVEERPADGAHFSERYAAPGLYADPHGGLHAVSLPGLRSGEPNVAVADAVAAAPLPAPRPAAISREVWPLLVAASMLLWLAGWALRLR
ncbi:MAG TPA: BatA domain-containing protein [Phycisphaerae bacterium]|nr:BatA domain-containing protein [Phycisphaerae bacterium]